MRCIFLSLLGGLLVGGSAFAQEVPRFTADVSGGFTRPVGTAGRNLDNGWNVGAGAGINFNAWLAAKVDVGYNDMDINSATLNSLGFPGGSFHIFSATLDPVLHLNHRGPVDLYLTGGGGIYHQYQQFTAPTVAFGTVFDPFFGFTTVGVPANQVLASYSINKPGFDAGAGIAFGTPYRVKVFAEAKYNRIFLSNGVRTDYIPVSFGFRW